MAEHHAADTELDLRKPKLWFTAKVSAFANGKHHIDYDNGCKETMDLMNLDAKRPAWELHPYRDADFYKKHGLVYMH